MGTDQILQYGTITKKQICSILGLVYPSGRSNYDMLNKEYFTDDLLVELNIDRSKLMKTKIFDKVQTRIIIGRFRLNLIKPSLSLLLH